MVLVAAIAPAVKIGTLAWSGVGWGVTDGVGLAVAASLEVAADGVDGGTTDGDPDGPPMQAESAHAAPKRPARRRHW